jgi:hypothetical protein
MRQKGNLTDTKGSVQDMRLSECFELNRSCHKIRNDFLYFPGIQ